MTVTRVYREGTESRYSFRDTLWRKVGIMNNPIPQSIEEMVEYLLVLATTRRKIMKELTEQFGSIRRLPLTAAQREAILEKTNKRCHLCGGEKMDGKELVIDHVFKQGGTEKD